VNDGLTLHLVLTHHWYDATENGDKTAEYRAMTPRWKHLIWDQRGDIRHVRFARGYTKRTITRTVQRIDIGPCPIPGWDGQFYRIHFSRAE
jgi:hypothetical protein